MITSLLQYDREGCALEFLRRRISLSNERNRRYYRYQRTLFSLERTGEMSKRAASKATSCPEKAPRFSVVNDEEFQSLQALQHTTPLSGCTFNNCSFSVPVPQPKHEEIVEDDFSSIDINEFLQF